MRLQCIAATGRQLLRKMRGVDIVIVRDRELSCNLGASRKLVIENNPKVLSSPEVYEVVSKVSATSLRPNWS